VAMDASQVAVDQVNVQTAQRNLNQATMTAPVSGTVSAVNVTAGQSVSASSSTHAVSIISPGAYAVTGAVSDAQIGEVAMGQLARVTPAGSTQALTGKVTSIAAVATVTSGVATFPVTVTIDGANPGLHAGVSATVNVIVSQISQVITVPTAGVRTAGAGSTVRVLVNGKPETRTVQVGASDPTRTQILSGINEGDLVIVGTTTSSTGTTRGTNRGNGRGGGAVPGGFGGGFGGGG
jgi:RND family efflux transporter MFP subunit